MQKPSSVDQYIAQFPNEVQDRLRTIRRVVLSVAPDITESISYGMPAYTYKSKPVGYFAAFSRHIGFYATPNAHSSFQDRLARYRQGKGSVQFPFDQPLPLDLIKDMVIFNLQTIEQS